MFCFIRHRQHSLYHWVVTKGTLIAIFFTLLFTLTLFANSRLANAQPLKQDTELPKPYNLSENEGRSDSAKLSIDGDGILHAVWWDESLTARLEVVHREMASDGKWSDITVLTEDFELPFSTMFPLVQPDGQYCVYWDGASDPTDTDTLGIYKRCEADDEWTETELVKATTGIGQDYSGAFDPDGSLQLIGREGAGDVMFNDIKLSDDLMLAIDPQFVIDRNGIYHVAFTRMGQPNSVEYRFSSDGGAQWKETERLSDDELAAEGASPIRLIADAEGGVHLVMNMGTAGIFYRHWTEEDGWQPGVELTQGEPGPTTTTLGVTTDADGLVHVVWHGIGVFYTHQDEDGTWTAPEMLSDAIGVGPGPDILIDEEGIRHVVWGSIDEGYDVYYLAF